ncbi:MAG: tRNA (guanosine(37)-N1)-methyltransferase TrmD [Planctomycetes bacterium]|nr:tRNA (guanosine(37)-N1)-methyltransferase TrmD [Planctomycetota bacterium]
MVINIITLFPEVFEPFIRHSIIRIAQEKALVKVHLHNLRDFSTDKHKKVDDKPYGGGAGMVLMVEPLHRAIEFLEKHGRKASRKVLLTPGGRRLSQPVAQELAGQDGLILLCGHYEGFDERIKELYKLDEISVGDYVLSGGEAPAMIILDAVTRLVPGVLGNPDSLKEESFSGPTAESQPRTDALIGGNEIEYPQYTRPPEYQGRKVPAVLLGGNHKEISKWRKERTKIKS